VAVTGIKTPVTPEPVKQTSSNFSTPSVQRVTPAGRKNFKIAPSELNSLPLPALRAVLAVEKHDHFISPPLAALRADRVG